MKTETELLEIKKRADAACAAKFMKTTAHLTVEQHCERGRIIHLFEKAAFTDIPAVVESHLELLASYHELIMSVGNKYEGETRHQTALRYIRQAERFWNTVPTQATEPPKGATP